MSLAVALSGDGADERTAKSSREQVRRDQPEEEEKGQTEACAPSEHPGKIWIHAGFDRKSVLVDSVSKGLADAERPPSCSRGLWRTDSCSENPRVHDSWCSNVPLPGKIEGMVAKQVAFNETAGAVVGHRADTPAYDMIAGYAVLPELKGKVRWSRPFNDGDPAGPKSGFNDHGVRSDVVAVANMRVVAVSASSVAAFDGTTGKTLWRIERTVQRGVIAHGDRVYVRSPRGLTVRTAADGTVIGKIGTP